MLKDIDFEDKVIKVDAHFFDIPNGLYRDLKEYLEIRKEHNSSQNNKDDFLFLESKTSDEFLVCFKRKMLTNIWKENIIIDKYTL